MIGEIAPSIRRTNNEGQMYTVPEDKHGVDRKVVCQNIAMLFGKGDDDLNRHRYQPAVKAAIDAIRARLA